MATFLMFLCLVLSVYSFVLRLVVLRQRKEHLKANANWLKERCDFKEEEANLRNQIRLLLQEGDFSRVREEISQGASVQWTEVYDMNTNVTYARYSGPDAEEKAGEHLVAIKTEVLTWRRLPPEEFLPEDSKILYRLLIKQ